MGLWYNKIFPSRSTRREKHQYFIGNGEICFSMYKNNSLFQSSNRSCGALEKRSSNVMNCHNFSLVSAAHNSSLSRFKNESFNNSIIPVLPWLISRSRIFLYLSNPYEESFEFQEQVADYHTEVSKKVTKCKIRRLLISDKCFSDYAVNVHIYHS